MALCAIMNGFRVYDDVCGLYCAYVLNVLEVSLKRHDAWFPTKCPFKSMFCMVIILSAFLY